MGFSSFSAVTSEAFQSNCFMSLLSHITDISGILLIDVPKSIVTSCPDNVMWNGAGPHHGLDTCLCCWMEAFLSNSEQRLAALVFCWISLNSGKAAACWGCTSTEFKVLVLCENSFFMHRGRLAWKRRPVLKHVEVAWRWGYTALENSGRSGCCSDKPPQVQVAYLILPFKQHHVVSKHQHILISLKEANCGLQITPCPTPQSPC